MAGFVGCSSSEESDDTAGACGAGQTRCSGVCVTFSQDIANCGGCGIICGAGQTCAGGVCTCTPGYQDCGAGCIDVAQSSLACGGCGIQCSPGELCQGGSCACQSGLTDCGAGCVNTLSDGANCGACGSACTGGTVCAAGTCGATCPTGTTPCGASCVTLATDPLNCGACSVTCPTGRTCNGGICGCPDGQTDCGGACTDTSTNALHCGGCGAPCAAGQACTGGTCMCPTNQLLCAGACRDVTTDSAHCGACGAPCAPGQTCIAGGCVGGGTGGAGTGGVTTGGAPTGGVPTGGQGTGGAPTGGALTGGAATGGVTTGGIATGGIATGGVSTGGVATGGVATGGVATGGAPTGGTGGDRCDVAVYNPSDPPQALTLSGSLGTHDPVIIEASGTFYQYNTANGIDSKTSSNLTSWTQSSKVFPGAIPAWVSQMVPGVSNLWAPDVSYFGGQYHIYYSASTFGSNRSCIGHVTRASLTSGAWADQGATICSNTGSTSDNWNAIDPNVVVDQAGTPWLSFGSFWSGIKLIQLDQNGNRVGTSLTSIAARPSNGGALEAPFIVRRCGYYYLFVSWDTCCQGVDSTYNIRVGRSTSVSGPYVDRNGTAMTAGGGTLVLQGNSSWRGPGHNAVIFTGTVAYNVYHAYNGSNGNPTLRISELAWDADGWPVSGGP